MQQEMMDVKEVAEYLRINFRLVYRLARERRIPGTNISGKWIFPKRLVDEWIEFNCRANCDFGMKKHKKDKLNVVWEQL